MKFHLKLCYRQRLIEGLFFNLWNFRPKTVSMCKNFFIHEKRKKCCRFIWIVCERRKEWRGAKKTYLWLFSLIANILKLSRAKYRKIRISPVVSLNYQTVKILTMGVKIENWRGNQKKISSNQCFADEKLKILPKMVFTNHWHFWFYFGKKCFSCWNFVRGCETLWNLNEKFHEL